MMYMELGIRERRIYCKLREEVTHAVIAYLRADELGDTWFVTSSTHADSKALNDFEATDQWIATSLLIGIARRLNGRILAGEEE